MRRLFYAKDNLYLENLPGGALAYLLASAEIPPAKRVLVIVEQAFQAEALFNDLHSYGVERVVLYPEMDRALLELLLASEQVTARAEAWRARSLEQSLTLKEPGAKSAPGEILISTPESLLRRVMPAADFWALRKVIKVGEEVDRSAFLEHCLLCGYQIVPPGVGELEEPGTLVVRGGVIDIFLAGFSEVVRLDFFGDELVALHTLPKNALRKELTTLTIHPLREVILGEEQILRAFKQLDNFIATLTEPQVKEQFLQRLPALKEALKARNYIYGLERLWPLFYKHTECLLESLLAPPLEHLVFLAMDKERLLLCLTEQKKRLVAALLKARSHHEFTADFSQLYAEPAEVVAYLDNYPTISLAPLATPPKSKLKTISLPLAEPQALKKALELRKKEAAIGEILDPLVSESKKIKERGETLFFLAHNQSSQERLAALFKARGLFFTPLTSLPPMTCPVKPGLFLVNAPITQGIQDLKRGILVLGERELLGLMPQLGSSQLPPAHKKAKPAKSFNALHELQIGDLVVHVDYGIGRYRGLVRLFLEGVKGEYVQLEYADGDKLYLPIYRLEVLQNYVGPRGNIKLDKLGSTHWVKIKSKVKEAVSTLAYELLKMQALRKAKKGFKFTLPVAEYLEFAALFPYSETPDQAAAIEEVLQDLTSGAPMDRLICGDVGFGKTEVALRAAFVAVFAHKQVAVLVPTTLLAEQHGETFKKRFKDYPVNVEVLSRFKTSAELQTILAKVKAGQIDILIGTHRLLSGDVLFKDLGLLIIDEEQRFGVTHKEHLKKMRALVHVLTLSATPIPRTLHMSLMGLRDLSLIKTPPPLRSEIITEVSKFSEELLKEVSERELARGGQVFIVHNRIRSLQPLVKLVERLVPQARVGFAHGRMSATILEAVMTDFIHGRYDILVSTAIIENGLDIPTVNTIIINRADLFGLAELHQLRGRVGRGDQQAYAYLLLPPELGQQPKAQERLQILKKFSRLGAGFKVATHDLDIRGGGELLGANQSGNIAAMGFTLYTQILQEAVEKAEGLPLKQFIEPEIKIAVQAMLPETYIKDPLTRLNYYERLSSAASAEEIDFIWQEISEVYGEAPLEVLNLRELMLLKSSLKHYGIPYLAASVQERALKFWLTLTKESSVDIARLVALCKEQPQIYKILADQRLSIELPLTPELSDPLTRDRHLLKAVRHKLAELHS